VGTVADELYGLPREEFVAARDARAREARAAGRDREAVEIGRLRKPTMAAWLANLLSREQPGEVRGLVRLGESLRKAHREVAGAALRQLSQQRHELVHALVTQARGLGRREGHRVSDAVGEELREIITAALTDPDAARTLAAGRLTSVHDVHPEADRSWPAAEAQAAPGKPAAGKPAAAKPQAGRARKAAQEEEARAERRRAEQQERQRRERELARADAEAAETARADAQRVLEDATGRAAAADRAVRELRERLAEAENAVTEGRRQVRSAQRGYASAERRARAAERRMRDLETGAG